jgi:hypothetical protein
VDTSTTATRAETGSTGAMRESGSRSDDTDVATSARVHMQPDSVVVTHTDSTHSAVGVDTTAAGTAAPAHKIRHSSAHWQSLLPGVMK